MDRVVVDRLSAARADSADEGVVLAGGAMTLPEGAEQNADGSVTLTLAYPITLRTRIAGSDVVHEEPIAELVLHRLTGADMRKVLAANNQMAQVALGRACDMPPARMAVAYQRLDASDLAAANGIVAELCGFSVADGLPETVTESDGVITLPLGHAAQPEGFELRTELAFHRLRGADMIAISQAKQTLPAAFARALRLQPKEADALFDAMDAADIMAAQRVIGFLSGSGRRTGR